MQAENEDSALHRLVGKGVALRGTALNAKAGAILQIEEFEPVYVQGLRRWPPGVWSKEVVASGLLKRIKYIPDPWTKNGRSQQGASGMQFVLEDAKWELAPTDE